MLDSNGDVRPLGLRPASLGVLVVAALLAWWGWYLTWHLVDDAFITYRYLSNVMAGHGLVWNPAPFERADGNTDFLWSMLLLFVWAVFDVEPPVIANWLGLGFGVATLWLLARAAERLPLNPAFVRLRPAVVALVLLPVASNRAFLASLSSGIGQAIFNFLLVAWVLTTNTVKADQSRRLLGLGALAGMVGLCRPEGHLVVAATALLLVLWRRDRVGLSAIALAVVPVLLHVIWRRCYYGSWLPCTYHAKSVEPWPEAGTKYVFTFVVEFALWAWLGVLVVWLAARIRRGEMFAPLARHNLGRSAVVGVFAVHFFYYTFRIGGDLFEWRPYTHLAILSPLALVALLRDLSSRPALVLGSAAGAMLLALPIPWLKFVHRDGDVAPHVPALLAPLLEPFDRAQAWLGQRTLCQRNHAMKVNYGVLLNSWPPRSEGAMITSGDYPVIAAQAVGLVAWVLPNVFVIDQHGLNDWIVAHTPVPTEAERRAAREAELAQHFAFFDRDQDGRIVAEDVREFLAALSPGLRAEALERAVQSEMVARDRDRDGAITREEFQFVNEADVVRRHAHERWPPPGYVAGFRPNVEFRNRQVTVVPRDPPLTAEQIRAHQARFRQQLP